MSEQPSCACSGNPEARQFMARVAAEDDAAMDALFKALASSPRRKLLQIIATQTSPQGSCCPTEICACDLAGALGLAPSTISHHMSVLVAAGLVTATKRGLWVYYGLERGTLSRAAQELLAL